ncbi:MAG TPA: fatty acyl-CoA reductase [Terriglobia bacterium]|nr:fatty acyl-CoA reductase [Terriglobia bacterium]
MTNVRQAFREHEILLTGANGFLGKVILGLLLDRFPDFKHLHILLRPRAELSAPERFFEETLRSPALSEIVQRRGESFLKTKISVWPGDIAQPGCGLAAENDLAGRVSLIINCAGRVDFFPPLDDSFSANVDGVENVITLSRNLGAKLLHVSTCFVCGEADGLIEESEPVLGYYPHRRGREDKHFDAREELRQAREIIAQIYESDGGDRSRRSRELAQRLVALGKQRAASWGWVNTYTYSKSLGEQLIASSPGLDYAIVRPAIVESAWRFPFPGWIEGGRTAAPLVLMALGGLRDWPVREDAPLEVIPVDMVASAILVVGALLLEARHEPVYQLGSADVNPIELGSIVKLLDAEARNRSNGGGARERSMLDWFAGTRRGAKVRFTSETAAQERRREQQRDIARAQRWLAGAGAFLEKTKIPGKGWLETCGTELRKLDLQAKFREQTLGQYLPFVLENRYIFECENIRGAYSVVSEAGRDLLPWRPEEIDWRTYWLENQIGGIEKWVQPEAVRDWTFKM